MNSVVRTAFGAALLLAATSPAMAQSANPQPAAPAAAANATVAANNAAPAPAAPAAAQPQKGKSAKVIDNTDVNGGHDPNSTDGIRAFFTPAY